jgi:predicted nucleic acid-binding protein
LIIKRNCIRDYQRNIYKMRNILIDADVILDFFFDRKPFSNDSTQIFSLCETEKINGFITPVICSNIYYILRQHAHHDKVIGKLKILLSITDVLTMDKEIVLQSLNSGLTDFEDALQNYSAIKYGKIKAIVTRNIKDYKHSTIGAITPENYLKILSANC